MGRLCAQWRVCGACFAGYYAAIVVLVQLAGCATSTPEPASAIGPAAVERSAQPAASTDSGFEGWTHKRLPGKRATNYQLMQLDGRWAVRADAQAAVSLFRRDVRVEPEDLGSIEFAWRVQAMLDSADLTQRSREDAPVRLLLAFEGDRNNFSAKNRMLSELSQTFTGEPLPYATLMYVWDAQASVGSIISAGSGTDRIRKLVLDSGATHVKTWRTHVRDIGQDYRVVFGEEPGALIGVALMTDSDNTRARAQAWYGPVRILDNTGQLR
ncbi:MAG: DUF3047 domain-containing protein [Rhizobacter sp.]